MVNKIKYISNYLYENSKQLLVYFFFFLVGLGCGLLITESTKINVLIGAIIGFVGSIIVSFIASHLASKRESIREKRENLKNAMSNLTREYDRFDHVYRKYSENSDVIDSLVDIKNDFENSKYIANNSNLSFFIEVYIDHSEENGERLLNNFHKYSKNRSKFLIATEIVLEGNEDQLSLVNNGKEYNHYHTELTDSYTIFKNDLKKHIKESI